MATLRSVDMQGVEQGAVEASDTVFDAPANDGLVQAVVVALMSAQRQGTHQTKTRHEVSGGGAKPFRQKGTGRARQGSSREPQMRGGGTVFGPRPRSYRQAVSPRLKRQALCCVLSDRVRNERLTVLSGLKIDAPKTKPFAKMVDNVAPEGRKTLPVTAGRDETLLLSARNLKHRVTVRSAADVNAVDVLKAARVVLQQEALPQLEERLS